FAEGAGIATPAGSEPAEGAAHAPDLLCQDAAENQSAAWRHRPEQVARVADEDIGLDVGDDDVCTPVAAPLGHIRGKKTDFSSEPVQGRVFPAHLDSHRIDIEARNRSETKERSGKSQDSGAAAGVQKARSPEAESPRPALAVRCQ